MKELELIYRKRKHQLLPIIFGFVAFFILVRVVMPQWTDITDAQSLITAKQSVIDAKEKSVLLLTSLPQENVDDDYNLATTALPLQKDIVLIFNQLNDVAVRVDVELGGFSVRVGEVYETAPSKAGSSRTVSGLPHLSIIVSVSGENANVRQFAEELYKSMPLVEISSLDVGRIDARYDVKFYYKPIVLRPKNDEATVIEPISPAERKQLDELRTWQSVVSE